MAILSKGTDFTTGDQVTAAKLDALVDNATFASGAVDDSTTQLDGSGRIIVKDSGITSAKLNLSATGVSQNIASFKTTQNGNNRVLNIRTPASTTDLDSPFEIQTANAIKFICDDHTVTIDSDGKVGIATEGPDEQLTVQAGSFGNNQDGGIAVQLGAESGSHFKTAFKCKTDGSGNARTAIDAPLSSTGGTTQEVISIDNDGKVGIGNTDPSSILDITQASGVAEINLSATQNDAVLSLNADTDQGSDSEIHFNAGTSTKGKIEYNHNSTADSQKMSFFAGNNSERLTILGDGKVGIGATSPTQELEVVGDITTNSIIAREGATDNCLRLLSDPEAPDGTNGGSQIQLFAQEASTASQIYHSARFHIFNPLSGSAVFQINSDANTAHFAGKLGIGKSDPDAALHIENTSEDQIILTNTSGNLSRIKSSRGLVLAADFDNNSGGTQSFVSFEVDNSEIMRVIGSTGIAVGQTTTPTSVAGSIFCAGRMGSLDTVSQTTSEAANVNIASTGLFRKSTSSARYKKNIEDYTKGIDELKLLRPVSFQSNNAEDSDKTYAGLIAEEVHDAGLTEFVSYNNDDEPDAIAYSNMVSLLTKALQESIAKIESLEARVTALES